MEKLKPFIKSGLRDFERLSKRVKEEVELVMNFHKSSLVKSLERCESPIEQLFYIHLRDVVENLRVELLNIDPKSAVEHSPQAEVSVNGKKYRLDFHVSCTLEGESYKFAIECDGHDFHEKTKEQVARDKSRERDLISAGYTVIRFTGSELWKSPFECSKETYEIIDNRIGISKYWQDYINSLIGGDQDGKTD